MLITLALATGMRRGELLGLRWGDIDLEKAMLHVKRTLSYIQTPSGAYVYVETEPKTASGRRSVALPAFVIEVLKRHRTHQVEARLRAKRWDDQDLVFCTNRTSVFTADLVFGVIR
jgi:integrase